MEPSVLTPKDALSIIFIATFSPESIWVASFTLAKPPKRN